MTNITDIRDSLIEVFDKLRDGDMDLKQAAEINNTAGKIINTAKVQLAYAALRGEQPSIPFLNTVATTSVPKLMEL
jgi:adhesin HecA-like repeat protein